jgi:hypothetical protein
LECYARKIIEDAEISSIDADVLETTNNEVTEALNTTAQDK